MTLFDNQGVRFLLAGIANTAFGYAVYALLLFSNAPLWLCVVGSLIGGLLFNYLTYGYFVFSGSSARQFVLFVLFYIIVTSVNLACLNILIAHDIPALMAQFILLPPMAGLSYIGLSRAVFRRKKDGLHAR